jgi:hypothetical protein
MKLRDQENSTHYFPSLDLLRWKHMHCTPVPVLVPAKSWHCKLRILSIEVLLIRIRDPVFFFYPWIRTKDKFFSGSRLPDPYCISKSLVTIFWVKNKKNTLILCQLAEMFFLPVQKIKQFYIFVFNLFFLLFLDLGSRMWDGKNKGPG